ncbi:MAG: HAMP domain-containing protein, partial [Chitinivibrionales bacterium]|nr:HAMP domain-containing protein [Chitinivibrionales bacterium]
MLLNLRIKLIGYFIILLFITLGSVVILVEWNVEIVLRHVVEEHLTTITNEKAESILKWLLERRADVTVFSQSSLVKEAVLNFQNRFSEKTIPTQLRTFIQSIYEQYHFYTNICIFTSSDESVFELQQFQPSPHFGDLLRRLKTDTATVLFSDIYLPSDTPSPTIQKPSVLPTIEAIAPIVYRDTPIGYVVMQVNTRFLQEIINMINVGRSGESYLVNRSGVIISHRDETKILKQNISQVEGIKLVLAGNSGIGSYTDYRGIAVLGAYRWIAPYRWGLIAEQDVKEAFNDTVIIRNRITVIALIAALLIIIATLYFSQHLVTPLRNLEKGIRVLSEKKFTGMIPVTSHDEIGTLTQSFNAMAAAVKEAYDKLQEQVSTTNKKLAERTEQLTRSGKLAAAGEIAAGVAHEINTPLATIKMLIHSLSEEKLLPKKYLQDILIIKSEIDRINLIILRFLQFARPKEPDFESSQVNDIIPRIIRLLQPLIEQHKIVVKTEYCREIPQLLMDSAQIGQVLLNIILNAIQAMQNGGIMQ